MASSGKITKPDPEKNKGDPKPGEKHWLEYMIALLLFLTLVAAGAAACYTRQQWLTADDTEVRQLRAYLYVEHGPLLTTSPDNRGTGAEISIHHAGSTPAYKIKLDAIIEVAPYLLNQTKLSDPIGMQGIQKYEYAILSGPKPIVQTISLVFHPDAMRLITSTDRLIGDHRFYLHGSVRYLDIFETERRYDFCFVFHPERNPAGSERGCEQYNKPG